MSGKAGLAIGLLTGLIIGLIAVAVSVHYMSGRTQARQGEAYEEGRKRGLEMATEGGLEISGHLNRGMAQDNQRMAELLDRTRLQLQALQARDDLTPQAKDQLAGVLAALGE